MLQLQILPFSSGAGFHFGDLYGIYRWDSQFNQKPGTYAVIASTRALMLAWWGDDMTYRNRIAVVDDFGSLVKVQA